MQFLIGERGQSISEDDLDQLLWEKDAVKALAASILQNGGVMDPIIVQRNGNKAKFLVREGNCRIVAERHLLEQHRNDTRFMTAPAKIFDVELTPEDLAVLLADTHVAGKIRHDAYEQAKQIYDLYHIYGKTYDWLGNHLRLSKSKIVELLKAYGATNEYLTAHPAPENVRKFSFFHELIKKKQLRDRFDESLEFKQTFHKWLTEGRITAAQQVRNLPLIVENAEAKKVLDEEGFEEAAKVLVRNDPALASDLFQAIKVATAKLKRAPASDIQDLRGGNAQKLIMLRNLYREIEDLATLAGVKL
jgi:hypothetical protein